MAATAIDYLRNLGVTPISKSNIVARKNYGKSVLDLNDTIYWGYRSLRDDNVTTAKTLLKWQDLCVGDANLFIYDKKLTVVGLIEDTYQDPEAYKKMGWTNGQNFDLIVKMKKIIINDPDILKLLKYSSTPTGFTIANKNAAKAFWDKYAHLLPLDPNALRNVAPAITLKTKSPNEMFDDDARTITEMNWRRFRGDIDTLGLGRNEKWHLDHMFSVAAAYAIGMPSWMVADPVNLHMAPGPENMSKNSKCGSIKPLMEKYPEWAYLEAIYLQKLNDGSATWTR